MKFGETFTEYLRGEQECFLEKCSHVEYKRLKKVLKSCRSCRTNQGSSCDVTTNREEDENGESSNELCLCESCPLCDQKFFSELMKEASEIAGCFSSRVRRLLHLHVSTGVQRYVLRLRHCFTNDQQIMIQQGRMLIEYVTMNAIAIRKILKKYDKVHSSVNGRNFRSKLRAEHIELLQSPWLIELGAFYINFNGSDGVSGEFVHQFSCDLTSDQPVMTLMVTDDVKLEYSLTCAICLEIVFNPYALSCGHIFCKACACSAASVMIFQGLKAAEPKSKCPVCREVGVYANPVHMMELDLLLKNRCKDYWKERMHAERAETVKQSKEYWDSQTKYVIGY
ncbi:zinc finger protein [Macleaya cordata]|uniref:RING-type E3 ubiquitin transferase n=1 Tax=Macleaya cordata TaxID=56857 RepID=A0A200PRM6_MACCD|nr:zinc finger protein [Macleaya cordata]